jgi:hypothetical protein
MNTPIKLNKIAPIFNFFDQVDNEDVNHVNHVIVLLKCITVPLLIWESI